jgi:hypothetical protein
MIDYIANFMNDTLDTIVYLTDNGTRVAGLLLIISFVSGVVMAVVNAIDDNFHSKITNKLAVTFMGVFFTSVILFMLALVNPLNSYIYYKPHSNAQWVTIYTNDIGADVVINTEDTTPTLKGGATLKRDVNRSHLVESKTTNATVTIQKGDESVTRNVLIGDVIGEPNQNSKITKIEYRPIDGYNATIDNHQSWELHKLTDYGEVRITFEPTKPSSELTKLYDGGNKN